MIIKGYSGVPDCARLVNLLHFAVAKSGCTSLFTDYVPTESNPADYPSRLGLEPLDISEADFDNLMGREIPEMTIPVFATQAGEWLPFADAARATWPEMR